METKNETVYHGMMTKRQFCEEAEKVTPVLLDKGPHRIYLQSQYWV